MPLSRRNDDSEEYYERDWHNRTTDDIAALRREVEDIKKFINRVIGWVAACQCIGMGVVGLLNYLKH